MLAHRARSVPKLFSNKDDMLARSTIETWVIKAEKGEQDCCPKCNGKVFEAEKLVSAAVSHFFLRFSRFCADKCNVQGYWYHKNCFRCVECERLLDSLTNNDGPGSLLNHF